MTGPGETGAVAPELERRMRDHVDAILAGGGVPAAERADLADELLGHLIERMAAHQAAGRPAATAATAAIAEFGGADRIGRELGQVYHSRLWASTIGTLLPAVAAPAGRPRVVRWLRFTVALGVVVATVGLVVSAWLETPLRAVLSLLLIGPGLAVLVLAYRALARGQRWALWYAIGICVSFVVWGVGAVVAPDIPGAITIPLGAILGGGVLAAVYASWDLLRPFTAGSRPVRGLLGIGLAGSLVAGQFAPALVGLVPDPTQASVADLELRVSMACDRTDFTEGSDRPLTDVQRITLVADATWGRTDLLPMGLWGVTNASNVGDTLGFHLPSEAPERLDWFLIENVPPTDVSDGTSVGWVGGVEPSEALVPQAASIFLAAVPSHAIRADHTIRTTWVLTPSESRAIPWPRIEVTYAHLDRYAVHAEVSCGMSVIGRQVTPD